LPQHHAKKRFSFAFFRICDRIQLRLKNKFTSVFLILQGISFAFQAFQVLRYAALMLAAIALAWLYAPQSLIDQYETLFLVGGATTFFWVSGLLDGFLLLQKKSDPLHTNAIVARTLRYAVLLSLLSATVCCAAGVLFYPAIEWTIVLTFAGFWGLETLSQFLPYYYIATGKSGRLLALSLVSGLGYASAVALPIALGFGLVYVLLALLSLAALKVAWLLYETGLGALATGAPTGVGHELLKISLPLILATLLSQSAVYVDGFLVQRYFSDDFVAFRYGAKEFPLVLLLANAMSSVRAGEIAAALRVGELPSALQGLHRSTDRLVWTMFPASLLLLVLSGPLFELVFAGRFPMAVPVFDLFLLLVIPRLMFPQSIVRAYQKTLAMTFSAGVELVLNVGLSVLLMQWYGIAGIAAATVIAFFAEKAILLGYVHFKLGIPWRRYSSIPAWVGWSLVMLLCWIAKYLFWPMWNS
jgi:O-antigen/teichoic acid export membrane protein